MSGKNRIMLITYASLKSAGEFDYSKNIAETKFHLFQFSVPDEEEMKSFVISTDKLLKVLSEEKYWEGEKGMLKQ